MNCNLMLDVFDMNAFVREMWEKSFTPDTTKDGKPTRQYLQTREAHWRKFPLHDGHVRAFLSSYTPSMRTLCQCPGCGNEMRRGDFPRDPKGKLRPHCGCRTGKKGGKPKGVFKYGFDTKTPEGKRLLKIMGASGHKPAKHDAHVKAFKALYCRKAKQGLLHCSHVWAFYKWRKQQPWYEEFIIEKNREKARLREAERMASDMGYRLNGRMRVSIRKALNGEKSGRRWESILGYTLEQLKAHFEKQLPKKMTVEKAMREGWHIDHIVPKSLYNLADEQELKAAWCMSNLRLIPARENLSKNDRRVFLL